MNLKGRNFLKLLDYTPEDAYEDEVRQGFVTVCGGHRVGVAGQVVLEHGRVKNVKHISFINIRVSHQIKGCAACLLPYVIRDGRLLHTLIISPPGCGKTTILRDLVRLISDGNSYCRGMNVGVVDERSELAACYMGIPQNDVGLRTDILDGCPKAEVVYYYERLKKLTLLRVLGKKGYDISPYYKKEFDTLKEENETIARFDEATIDDILNYVEGNYNRIKQDFLNGRKEDEQAAKGIDDIENGVASQTQHRRWSKWTIEAYHTLDGNANIISFSFPSIGKRYCTEKSEKMYVKF